VRRLTAAAVVALAAAGCGSDWHPAGAPDTHAVTRVVADYLDMVRTCQVITKDAGSQLADQVRGALPPGTRTPVRTCDEARRLLVFVGSADRAAAGIMDYRVAQDPLGSRELGRVEVSGDSARTHVGGSRKEVELVRQGGRWRISQLDFSDVPKGH
jgi:hypothetical protein